jgi:hypothetical protein
MSTKTFANWRTGAIHLNLPNGNHISTTWAPYSYSDNYDLSPEEVAVTYTRINPIIESDTVEMMITCGEKLLKKLEKKYNGGDNQPFGRLKFDEWLDIVNKVSQE